MTVHQDKYTSSGLPRLPLDLTQHRTPIAIQWSITLLTSCLLPIIGYFALHYTTSQPLGVQVSPWLGLMGVTSLFSLGTRTWSLVKKNSTCRPLGSDSRWALDYFGWNFLFGFLALTVLIIIGTSTASIYVVSLPASVLVLYVCLELVVVQICMLVPGVRAPFRFSSVAKGMELRPGSYVIAEDVVAVDGKQGREFRRAWSDRYEASAELRRHLKTVDWIWGLSGLGIVAVVWGVIFGVDNHQVGYAVGWGLPWLWAGGMTVLTIWLSKRMLKREAEVYGRSESV